MLKKYNIALMPISKKEEIIQFAQHFSAISDEYQLGMHSLPHITLCHFHAEEKNIQAIWQRICQALPKQGIELTLTDFSCITFNGIIFWISLIPNQRSVLNTMHRIVATIVKEPVNAYYTPHMTLANTRDAQYGKKITEITKFYTALSDQFILSIGACDSIGQLTKLFFKAV